MLDFENDGDFDEQTEFDVRSLSLKHRLTVQELKVVSVGSVSISVFQGPKCNNFVGGGAKHPIFSDQKLT